MVPFAGWSMPLSYGDVGQGMPMQLGAVKLPLKFVLQSLHTTMFERRLDSLTYPT